MKATPPKSRTDEVRLHSSAKTKAGKTYEQHCVRWYQGGVRKQRCFGQIKDAEAFRDSILAERARAVKVPRGLRVVVESLSTGQRLLFSAKAGAFLQDRGQDPQPLTLSAAVVVLEDFIGGHDGHTFHDGQGVHGFLTTVAAKLPGGDLHEQLQRLAELLKVTPEEALKTAVKSSLLRHTPCDALERYEASLRSRSGKGGK